VATYICTGDTPLQFVAQLGHLTAQRGKWDYDLAIKRDDTKFEKATKKQNMHEL
jgi:hypothetical protein